MTGKGHIFHSLELHALSTPCGVGLSVLDSSATWYLIFLCVQHAKPDLAEKEEKQEFSIYAPGERSFGVGWRPNLRERWTIAPRCVWMGGHPQGRNSSQGRIGVSSWQSATRSRSKAFFSTISMCLSTFPISSSLPAYKRTTFFPVVVCFLFRRGTLTVVINISFLFFLSAATRSSGLALESADGDYRLR